MRIRSVFSSIVIYTEMSDESVPPKSDRILFGDVMTFVADYFDYLSYDTDMSFDIINSFNDFWTDKGFLTLKQFAVIEKMYFKFKLNEGKNIIRFGRYENDPNRVRELSDRCDIFFRRYYINNDYAEREHRGEKELTKKILYDIVNDKS